MKGVIFYIKIEEALILLTPQIQEMEESLKSVGMLLTAIATLSTVIVHLYRRTNKLNDRITDLQEQFRTEIVSVHEKTLAIIPNMENNVVERLSNKIDKSVGELKETIKDNK